MSLARIVAIAAWLAFLALVLASGHVRNYVAAFQEHALLAAVAGFGGLVAAALAAGGFVRGIGGLREWSETAAHAAPLLLFSLIGPTSLDSHSLRVMNAWAPRASDDARVAAPPAVTQQPAAPASGYQATDLLEVRYFPHLQGGKVELIGKIGVMESTYGRRKGQSPTLRTVLFRHVMTCCAADAQPITADLETLPAEAPHEVWVRVRGSANARETPGQTPVIHVDSIERVDAPESPYLDYRGPGAEGPPAPGSS